MSQMTILVLKQHGCPNPAAKICKRLLGTKHLGLRRPYVSALAASGMARRAQRTHNAVTLVVPWLTWLEMDVFKHWGAIQKGNGIAALALHGVTSWVYDRGAG